MLMTFEFAERLNGSICTPQVRVAHLVAALLIRCCSSSGRPEECAVCCPLVGTSVRWHFNDSLKTLWEPWANCKALGD